MEGGTIVALVACGENTDGGNMHPLLHHAWGRLTGLMPGEIQQSEPMWLLSPSTHFPILVHRRATMIVSRVRLFAFLFAVLTPLWSIVDFIVFPFPLWFVLGCLRVAASLAFASLAMYACTHGSLLNAYRGMVLLFAIPTVFFVFSHEILAAHQLTGISAAIASGYAFLPFVLLAGLAIFPLTLAESLAFATPMLLAQLLPPLIHLEVLDWTPIAGQFWLLTLIAAVSTMAGLSQLTFMIAIVQQAVRDPLTGAYSRRSGQEALEIQFALAMRTDSPLTVAFLDLDDFKSINDVYGHDAGDRVLANVGQSLMTGIRRGDIFCRWGGEEFLVIMPNTDLEQAGHALGRIRENGFGTRPDGKFPLTASMGIAEWRSDDAADWKTLVEIADRRMYMAKAPRKGQAMAHGGPSPAMFRNSTAGYQ